MERSSALPCRWEQQFALPKAEEAMRTVNLCENRVFSSTITLFLEKDF